MRQAALAMVFLAGSALAAISAPAWAQDRHAPAHVHGVAGLNIAIEDGTVTMELTVPAADIVGFEHAPRGHAEHTDIRQAITTLADPYQVVAFPAGAGCRVESAQVDHVLEIGGHDEDHDHSHGHSHSHSHSHSHDHGAADADEDGHAEFVALYRLACASIDRLTGLTFPLFELYPSIRQLRVQAITQAGQAGFDIDAARPEISLRGLAR